MPILDTYTIYFLIFMGNLVMCLMLLIFAKTTGFEVLMRYYTYAKLLQTSGAGVLLFRGIVPVDFSVIVGNGLVFLGIALEVCCIVHIDRVPLKSVVKRWLQVAAGLAVGFALLYLAGANIGIRAFISAMSIAVYSLVAAAGLFFRSNSTNLRRVVALFFLILAACQVIRALYAFSLGPNHAPFSLSLSQMFAFISLYLHMLISTMSFLLMSREVIDIRLQEAATKDFLTGIYNRAQFMHMSEKLLSLMIRQQRPVTVFMIDCDNFKVINDTFGHAVGDSVLVNFSQDTQAILRKEDLFGRYGGEEFIIFSPNTADSDALIMGKKIQSAILLSVAGDLTIPKYTISIGTATMIPEELADMEKLIKQADQALLQAKRNGRNQIVQFNEP